MVGALLLPDVSRGEERRPVPVIARDGWPAPPLAALANLAAFQYERVCVESEQYAATAEGEGTDSEGTAAPRPPSGCACAGPCSPLGQTSCHASAPARGPDSAYDAVVQACTDACACPATCPLRAVDAGVTVAMAVTYFGPAKGWGVVALEAVPAGTVVGAYVGERILLPEAQERWRAAGPDAANYILCIGAHRAPVWFHYFSAAGTLWTIVDATETGNVARFLNHSCDPTLVVVPVWHAGRAEPTAALVTVRTVREGEELTFDYGATAPGAPSADASRLRRRPCACGASNCRGILPFDPTL